jgi:hypothetical protein
MSAQDETGPFSPAWCLWLVAVFIGTLELAWWFLWHVLNA